MRFGIFDQVDQSGRPLAVHYEERLQLAELYDELGFHCYHQSEHHATPLSMAPSQSVFLAAMAQRTRRLRLCPLVYLLPIHHPLRLAEEICMLDHLSGGRFEFGIGRGASPHEVAAFGVDPAHALDAYLEAFEVLGRCFREPVIRHAGRFWRIDDVPVPLKPLQQPHPPMWYAAATPDAAAWPAQHGLNLICGGPVQNVPRVAERYRAEAPPAAGGAPGAGACVGVWRFVVVADTDDAAMRIAERAWPRFRESFYALWRRHGTEPQRVRLADDFAGTAAVGHGVAGSPDTVARLIETQLRDGRLNYFAGHFMFGDMPLADAKRSVRLFGTEVMPRLAEAARAWL